MLELPINLKLNPSHTRLLLKLLSGGILMVSYYVYYSYYINLIEPNLPLVISRISNSSTLVLDMQGGATDLRLGIKLLSAGVFFLIFALGYSAFVYAAYNSVESIKQMLLVYITLVCISGLILLIALSIGNHDFLYRAGAEIKNFAWSPLFIMLIVLAPYTSLVRNIRKHINDSTFF